jgi:hypothetical protein
MLKDVRTHVAPLASTQLSANAAADHVELLAARAAIAGDDPWLQLWFQEYWKNPIVSSALREARGEEIVQGAN